MGDELPLLVVSFEGVGERHPLPVSLFEGVGLLPPTIYVVEDEPLSYVAFLGMAEFLSIL